MTKLRHFFRVFLQAETRGITLAERQRLKHQLRRSASSFVCSSRPSGPPLLWARGGGGLVQWVLFLSLSPPRKSQQQNQLSQAGAGLGGGCCARGDGQLGGTGGCRLLTSGDRGMTEKKETPRALNSHDMEGKNSSLSDPHLAGGTQDSAAQQDSSLRGKTGSSSDGTKAVVRIEEGGTSGVRGGGGKPRGGGGLAAIMAAVAAAEGGGRGGLGGGGDEEIEISIEGLLADDGGGGGQVSQSRLCKSFSKVSILVRRPVFFKQCSECLFYIRDCCLHSKK